MALFLSLSPRICGSPSFIKNHSHQEDAIVVCTSLWQDIQGESNNGRNLFSFSVVFSPMNFFPISRFTNLVIVNENQIENGNVHCIT
jgi:hypothetical protein